MIGSKFQKGNKLMAQHKEEAQYGDLVQARKLRVHQREANARTSAVEKQHSVLMSEYDQLLTQNMYFTKIANDVITL